MQRNVLNSYFIPYTKFNSTWFTGLNEKFIYNFAENTGFVFSLPKVGQ